MSTHKEKAQELIDKFIKYCDHSIDKTIIDEYDKIYDNKKTFTQIAEFALKYHAKQSALICVDEIIKAIESIIGDQKHMWREGEKDQWEYYKAIKEELLKP